MNILILTGKFGMGHYSAAEAIKQEIEENYKDINVNIKIIDIIDYLFPAISSYVYKSFDTLVSKWANLYNFINTNNEERNIKTFNYLFIKKLDKLFDKYNPEVVISTLPISSQYISKYKSIKKSNVPLLTFITDISSHSEWIHKNTNYYFVGDEKIKGSLVNKGISEEKIIITGIPVRKQFREIDMDLNKNNKKKEVLIMGGGLGLISVNDELFEVLNNVKDIKTTIITGNNKSMYEYLRDKYKNIKVIGYTEEVSKYMKNSDLIISKSGGITLFEAIYSEVPMYVINPFLVQEIKNSKFIEKEKIGRVIRDKDFDIVSDILNLINDDYEITKMKNNMKNIKSRINQNEIINVLDKFMKGA
ncbi:MGDG synthase family glycosyltransferase [Clostridium saudiense]|uniref:MGDG synthase family glycosyltransferase n=1 Tax=Clostridium saudiense TaxID=1414720 RepID=UPI0018AA0F68|nr:glycosyltransferase [Clostridium saudiense]